VNDDEEHIRAVLAFIKPYKNVVDYELLPYMRFGESKYGFLGRIYEMADFIPRQRKPSSGCRRSSTRLLPTNQTEVADMEILRTFFEQQQLLSMFVVIGLGYALGGVNISGFALGAGAVLFVGLAAACLRPMFPRLRWSARSAC